MRLIDADYLKELFDPNTWQGDMLRTIIDKFPTAYDVEKVVERLELENKRLKTLRNNCITLGDHEVIGIESRAYNYAIEIVKRGGQG